MLSFDFKLFIGDVFLIDKFCDLISCCTVEVKFYIAIYMYWEDFERIRGETMDDEIFYFALLEFYITKLASLQMSNRDFSATDWNRVSTIFHCLNSNKVCFILCFFINHLITIFYKHTIRLTWIFSITKNNFCTFFVVIRSFNINGIALILVVERVICYGILGKEVVFHLVFL